MIRMVSGSILAGLLLASCQTPGYAKAQESALAMKAKSCNLPTESPLLKHELWVAKSGVYLVRTSCHAPTFKLIDGKPIRQLGSVTWTTYVCQDASCTALEGVGDWDSTTVATAAPVPVAPAPVPVAPAPVPVAPAPVSAAPAAAAVPSAPSAEAVKADAMVRAALDARASDILACVQADKALLVATFDNNALTVSLAGSLAGTPAEGCVRSVLQGLAIPENLGPSTRVMHLVRAK